MTWSVDNVTLFQRESSEFSQIVHEFLACVFILSSKLKSVLSICKVSKCKVSKCKYNFLNSSHHILYQSCNEPMSNNQIYTVSLIVHIMRLSQDRFPKSLPVAVHSRLELHHRSGLSL